jgi:hypothetical protein
MICLFVDDFFLACTCDVWVDALVAFLRSKLEIKDLGDLTLALGMEVARDIEAGTLKVTQEKYLRSCLQRFGREDVKTVSSPCYTVDLAGPNGQPLDSPLPLRELKEYQEMVGCAMYAAICTRFDILYAVGRCARHMVAPTRLHQLWIRRIFAYLAGTLSTGLLYRRPSDPSDMDVLVAYSDSDFGGAELDPLDGIKHKSTTGYCFLLHGAAVAAASRLQPTVAASTAEAEYYALGSATMVHSACATFSRSSACHRDQRSCMKIIRHVSRSPPVRSAALRLNILR